MMCSYACGFKIANVVPPFQDIHLYGILTVVNDFWSTFEETGEYFLPIDLVCFMSQSKFSTTWGVQIYSFQWFIKVYINYQGNVLKIYLGIIT